MVQSASILLYRKLIHIATKLSVGYGYVYLRLDAGHSIERKVTPATRSPSSGIRFFASCNRVI